MSNAKMRDGIYKQGKRWYVQLELPRDPQTGERQRRVLSGFRTRKEAEQARDDARARLTRGTFVEPTKLTVAIYLEQWLTITRQRVRPGTYASYELHVRRYIVPRVGWARLQELTTTQVKTMYAELAESGAERRTGGLSEKTVHNIHVTLRKALGDAVDDGLIFRNPAARAHRAPTERPEIDVWDSEQLRAFLDHVRESGLPRIRLHALRHSHATSEFEGRGAHGGRKPAARAREGVDHRGPLPARAPGHGRRGRGADGGVDRRGPRVSTRVGVRHCADCSRLDVRNWLRSPGTAAQENRPWSGWSCGSPRRAGRGRLRRAVLRRGWISGQ